MITTLTCQATIAAQSTSYPTYIGLDCDLLTTQTTPSGFYGIDLDCDLTTLAGLVAACMSASQRIRI